jgi:hypothetical protein
MKDTSVSNKIIRKKPMLVLNTRNDVLLNFLTRLSLSPIQLGLVVLFIFNIPFFLYAFFTNNLLTHGNVIGLLNDPNFLLLDLISVPVTIAFYLWLPFGISQVISRLATITSATEEDSSLTPFHKSVESLGDIQDQRLWFVIALVVVVVYEIAVTIPQHMNFKNILSTNQAVLVSYEIMYIPAYYATLIIAMRGITFAVWLSRIFSKFNVMVRPYHPDRAGGLGFIGDYATKTGYMIGTWGLAIITVLFTEGRQLQTGEQFYLAPLTIVPLGLYLVFAPFAFLAPLWNGHLAMKRMRDEQLEYTSVEMASILTHITHERLDTEHIKSGVERLNELEKLNDIILKRPIYPFNVPDLVSYLAKTWGALLLSLFSGWVSNQIK